MANVQQLRRLGILSLIVVLTPGCAVFRKKEGPSLNSAGPVVPVIPVIPVINETTPHPNTNPQPLSRPNSPQYTLVESLNRSDFENIEKIAINLTHADVSLVGNVPARKGRLKLERVAGDQNCLVKMSETNQTLDLTDDSKPDLELNSSRHKSALPPSSRCHFSIEIGLPEAIETSIALTRGLVSAEAWDAALELKIAWGDIDVGSVGPLNVNCGRCTLTGDGVSGPFHYALNVGNVGVSGLSDSVDGRTLGDTVLKWKKIKSDSNVKVASHAGDVILFFPRFAPLALSLQAPRGEVFSKESEREHGVPVSASAELGNIQLYRETILSAKKAEEALQ